LFASKKLQKSYNFNSTEKKLKILKSFKVIASFKSCIKSNFCFHTRGLEFFKLNLTGES